MRAAGGIVVRRDGDDVRTVIIHRPRHADWSFPKGKLDLGETFEEAALREVREETGLRCALLAEVTSADEPVSYRGPGAVKLARYWFMAIVRDDGFEPTAEVDDLRWVSIGTAAEALTHPLDRALAARAAVALR